MTYITTEKLVDRYLDRDKNGIELFGSLINLFTPILSQKNGFAAMWR